MRTLKALVFKEIEPHFEFFKEEIHRELSQMKSDLKAKLQSLSSRIQWESEEWRSEVQIQSKHLSSLHLGFSNLTNAFKNLELSHIQTQESAGIPVSYEVADIEIKDAQENLNVSQQFELMRSLSPTSLATIKDLGIDINGNSDVK